MRHRKLNICSDRIKKIKIFSAIMPDIDGFVMANIDFYVDYKFVQ